MSSVVRYIGILLISGILNHTILYFFHPQPGIVIGVILLPVSAVSINARLLQKLNRHVQKLDRHVQVPCK